MINNYDGEKILNDIKNGIISPAEGLKQLEVIKNIAKSGSLNKEVYYYNQYAKENVNTDNNLNSKTILIFSENELDIKEYENINALRKVVAIKGKEFKKINSEKYIVNYLNEENYSKLFKSLEEDKIEPTVIIHDGSKRDYSNDLVEECINETITEILFLSKALILNLGKSYVSLLYFYKYSNKIQPFYEGVSGFLKTLILESNKINTKIIAIDKDTDYGEAIYREATSIKLSFEEVKYIQNIRYTNKLVQYKSITNKELNIKNGGTYIITGGAGELGFLFANSIVRKFKCNIILLGRSKLTSKKEEKIKELNLYKGNVSYVECDVCNRKSVRDLIKSIKKSNKSINGIIHCAGIIKDTFILKKDIKEFKEVIKPKVYGTINLDEETKKENLDFFILFSSIAGSFGNIGQCDYAYANSFMNEYAKYNNSESRNFIAINWPFWSNGGMKTTDITINNMKDNWGIVPLDDEVGQVALSIALNSDLDNLIVLQGDVDKIKSSMSNLYKIKENTLKVHVDDGADSSDLYIKTENYLKELLSTETKIPVNRIDSNEELESYGIDSVMIMNLNDKLSNEFNNLSKTLFYEYIDIASLTEYFVHNFKDKLTKKFNINEQKVSNIKKVERVIEKTDENRKLNYAKSIEDYSDDIAIIGVDGIYPKANSLEEFWENLKNGIDCVTEIPEDRWDWKINFDSDKSKKGISYSKWGGFIDDVDKFDPIFFKIAPKEANITDPQERMFLEVAWKTIEGAGYTRKKLSKNTVGVFVGVMYGHYQMYGAEESLKNNVMALNSSFSSIANRVSYFMNFNGPSIALDTMCSSSITAIHLACDSIKNGECDIALAGGVNLSLHPNKYIMLSQGKFASSEGKCRSFGAGGDGYVPGEGVGAVLLKSFKKAEEDNDIIYGVIKGTAINHGGKTNGYSVPNPNAQYELIKKTINKAKIDPRTINYIEAHGTGTSLGDPIEITGLTKAFNEYSVTKESCAIGSVKSNIGHLESAAGIAALTKVLLQFKNKQLAPSIHSEVLNKNINFKDTPFYVQRNLSKWESPSAFANNPRRAGISAFGAGGSNAHLIVEEYEDKKYQNQVSLDNNIFILSARDEERLKEYASKYIEWLKLNKSNDTQNKQQKDAVINRLKVITSEILNVNKSDIYEEDDFTELGYDVITLEEMSLKVSSTYNTEISMKILSMYNSINSLAQFICSNTNNYKYDDYTFFNNLIYTVQTAREEMDERLAFVATSVNEIIQKLEEYIAGNFNDKEIYTGNILNIEITDEKQITSKSDIDDLIEIKEYSILAELWVNGEKIEWTKFYSNKEVKIVRIPTYPFAKESCWYVKDGEKNNIITSTNKSLHPLIDENISTFKEQCFKKVLSLKDKVISDHIVNNQYILPGVAYIEMIRFAGELAGGKKVKSIEDIIWKRPIVLDAEEKEVYIRLAIEGSRVSCKVTGASEADFDIYCEAIINYEDKLEGRSNFIDISKLKENFIEVKNKEEIHEELKRLGFDYGNSFIVTDKIYEGEIDGLSELEANDSSMDFVLDPFLLDSALRTVGGIKKEKSNEQKIPFSIGLININNSIPKKCYVYATITSSSKGINKYDIYVVNENDEVVVEIKDFMARSMKKSSNIHYFKPSWNVNKSRIDEMKINYSSKTNFVIFAKNHKIEKEFKRLGNKLLGKEVNIITVKKGESYEKDNNGYTVNLSLESDYITLFNDLKDRGIEPNYILYGMQLNENNEVDLNSSLYSMKKIFKVVTKLFSELKVRCLFAYYEKERYDMQLAGTISGFSKSLTMLNHLFELVSVSFNKSNFDMANISESLFDELGNSSNKSGTELSYRDNVKEVRIVEKVELTEEKINLTKPNGVYVITGGAGGIGSKLARNMAKENKVNIILLGKSELNSAKGKLIDEINELGSQAEYYQVDICDEIEVNRLFRNVRNSYGKINGVIHCAGIDSKISMLEASDEEFEKVLNPKVYGTKYLDEATKNEQLDYFILFSSLSSIVGDFGVGSYSAANGFLDHFAYYRNNLLSKGKRTGKTISINWSLWNDGGMDFSKEDDSSKVFFNYSGMEGLDSKDAIESLKTILNSNETQLIVAAGDRGKIEKVLKIAREDATVLIDYKDNTNINYKKTNELKEKVIEYLKLILSETINFPINKINPKVSFEQYGVDSVIIMDLNKLLEKDFKSLPSTLFFEYTNIDELSDFIISKYKDVLLSKFNLYEEDEIELEDKMENIQVIQTKESVNDDDIAIIGMDGRFPLAENLEEYWNNISQGKECIEIIPSERWDYRKYFSEDKSEIGKTYSKWGGFIPDVDKFDPLFFNISPLEAELMDPQERLFLEVAWSSIEDAGYTRKTLAKYNTGVFVGAMYGHYQLISAEKYKGEDYIAGSIFSTIANRVSYFMKLTGPSVAIDTACSSAVEAIRQGCQNILDGVCDMAICGGINLSIHPNKYLYLSQAGFLSSDGKCRSFAANGDGYVPGEGAGAVVLKRLSDAVKDKDHIYGVIKGMSIKHTGNSNGYGMPNLNTQVNLLEETLKKTKILPSTISYIESAALGVEMGDKIEVESLSRVFTKDQNCNKDDCVIGSVKANIGHLESASGIAALIKVLLQMKNKMLVPSINFDEPNPQINFDEIPFSVQNQLIEWKNNETIPRRALIDSFGAGGTYLNMIVEEYSDNDMNIRANKEMIFTLSCKDIENLKEYSKRILNFLDKNEEINLERLIYTLQVGREEMEARLAIVTRSISDLKNKLNEVISGDIHNEHIFINSQIDNINLLISGEDGTEFISKITKARDMKKIAQLWVSGIEVNWHDFYDDYVPRKISLPTYPFKKVRCWLDTELNDSDINEEEIEVIEKKEEINNIPSLSSEEEIKVNLINTICKYLRISKKDLKTSEKLKKYGFDSLVGMKLANHLKKIYGSSISIKEIFEKETVDELVKYLVKAEKKDEESLILDDYDEDFYKSLIDELVDE